MKLLERRQQTNFLEKRRPTEAKSSIEGIDVSKYRQLGVNTLFLDAEGTLVEHDGWKIDQGVVDKIREFRESGFENIVIVSNKKPKDEQTFVKMNYWAHQIDADYIFTPEAKNERKPHPDLLLKAAAFLGIEAKQALMVGDKLTADVKAANEAGMYSVFVQRRGAKDMLGDRLVRRPYEEHLLAEMDGFEDDFVPGEMPRFSVNELPEEMSLPSWMEGLDSDLISRSKIVNLGPIQASSITLDKGLPKPIKRVKKTIKSHYHEHGRTHADVATKFRRVAGYVAGALILFDRPEDAKKVTVVAKGSDIYDGKAARADKRGSTPEGAVNDISADRENTRALVVPAVMKGRLKARHAIVRMLSDQVKKPLREYYKKRGVDVKAGWPGKGSAFVEDVAEISMLTEDNREWVQYVADLAKLGSVPAYAVIWEMKARKLEKERPLFEEAKRALLAEAA